MGTGFLSQYTGTDRIYLDDQHVPSSWWVEIKKYLSHQDEADCEKLLWDPPPGFHGQSAYRIRRVTLAVVAWNLTDEDDKPLPLGDESSILRLPSFVFNTIYARVNESAAPRKGEAATTFPVANGSRNPVGAESTPGA